LHPITVVEFVEEVFQDWPDHNAWRRSRWVKVMTTDGWAFFSRDPEKRLSVSSKSMQEGNEVLLAQVSCKNTELAGIAAFLLREKRLLRKEALVSLESIKGGAQAGFRGITSKMASAIPMDQNEADQFDRMEKFITTIMDTVPPERMPTGGPMLIDAEF
jgi:hypothetical protein